MGRKRVVAHDVNKFRSAVKGIAAPRKRLLKRLFLAEYGEVTPRNDAYWTNRLCGWSYYSDDELKFVNEFIERYNLSTQNKTETPLTNPIRRFFTNS